MIQTVSIAKTEKKGRGIEQISSHIYICSGVQKDRSAAKGVSILILRTLKGKINWKIINDLIE